MSFLNSRRNFLKGLAATSLPLGLGGPMVHAYSMAKRDHFFVTLNIWGAMDVTLSLDPWLKAQLPDPKDMFIEYSPSEVLELSTGVKVGPALEFINKHAHDVAIVNGVFMSESDIGHETLREYMITGSLQGLASSFGLEASTYLGQKGLGSIIDSSMFPTGAHLTSSLGHLKNLDSMDKRILDIVSLTPKNDPFSFAKSLWEAPNSAPLILDFIRLKKDFTTEDGVTEPYLAAAALMSGSAMSVEIDFEDFDLGVNSLDTHLSHPEIHLKNQIKAWQIVDDFFTTFKKIPFNNYGESLFDHTTFMISNEFSRTPFLNSLGGKDHNPLTNSLLFAGKGIQGGQVIGGSHLIPRNESPTNEAYHIALPIDYKTGLATQSLQANSNMIFPENIMATLCELFSVPQLQHPALQKSTRVLGPLLRK